MRLPFLSLALLPAALAFNPPLNPPDILLPKANHLLAGNLSVGLSVDVGSMPVGNVTVIPITGGAVQGPNLTGKVLAIGADWGITTPQGIYYPDIRTQIRTLDGANIYLQMTGWMQHDNTTYVRTVFQTGSPNYAWLNYVVAFGVLGGSSTGFVVDIWQFTQ
ncbi:hypothetical protein GQ53DRAFT_809194 [Thozetella sp. PMI_491]|nr:hypothetical protein GQ53DRAFT_809194 [Thozetella sp. PMI_491]